MRRRRVDAHDDERPTAAYRSLHLITSRDRTEFGELPMPEGTPDYPSRDAVGRYLEGYAEHVRPAGPRSA